VLHAEHAEDAGNGVELRLRIRFVADLDDRGQRHGPGSSVNTPAYLLRARRRSHETGENDRNHLSSRNDQLVP